MSGNFLFALIIVKIVYVITINQTKDVKTASKCIILSFCYNDVFSMKMVFSKSQPHIYTSCLITGTLIVYSRIYGVMRFLAQDCMY